jgi:hypothetical protein
MEPSKFDKEQRAVDIFLSAAGFERLRVKDDRNAGIRRLPDPV